MTLDNKANKARFLELLRSTNRDGVEDLIEELEENGFFTAPASAVHHLNTEGGLVQHSLYTCDAALQVLEGMTKIDPSLANEVSRESVIIASLLHDVCKSDFYVRTVRKRKTSIGTWEANEGYKTTYKNLPIGHGEKSVIMVLCTGMELSESEMLAIRWHMGPWALNFHNVEEQRYFDASKVLYPLVSIIQVADYLAASILEKDVEKIDDL
jgi:hypothetical protein